MSNNFRLSYQAAFRTFSDLSRWKAPYAVTLTMKQGVVAADGARSVLIRLDRNIASKNYRHFLNLLSRAALGKGASRSGRRLQSISVIEGGQNKRLHCHSVIDCPDERLIEDFPSMITRAWRKTDWGQSEIDVQPGADAGWIDYISKFRDKDNLPDAIDWVNCHINDCRA